MNLWDTSVTKRLDQTKPIRGSILYQDERQASTKPTAELGVAGARVSSGFVHDEFINRLIGERGQRVYREMRDNDATISGILFAVEMLMRSTKWKVESGEVEETQTESNAETDESSGKRSISTPKEAEEFLRSVLFDDMDHTWDDFISNVLTMLTFGWQWTEIVYKRRNGAQSENSQKPSSLFDDGLIGIHKLADRSQETLWRWDIDDQGKVYGMWQEPPNGFGQKGILYIPMAKSLIFKPKQYKGSPEGRSALRGAYRSWYFLKNMQEIEAIGIERELAGLPVVYIPNEIIVAAGNGDANAMQSLAKYTKMVRDIKFNEQGGVVLPSNPFYDREGNPTNTPQVKLELLTSGGSRTIDVGETIMRYQGDIARTILADFIILGQGDKGSFALSKNKTDLFLKAVTGWLESIAENLNRNLIPKIWSMNGLDPKIMPKLVPGNIAPVDLGELGDFVQKLAGAGINLTDIDTENYLRTTADMPEADESDAEPVVSFEEE